MSSAFCVQSSGAALSFPLRASIVIVSYNSLPDLQEGLPALADSLTQRDEVILVDNASADGTVDWVCRHHPWVRVIESGENLGFGGANNLGARAAHGDVLVFLNPDTVVEPGWLDVLLASLLSHPEAGLATPKIVLKQDPQRINCCGNDVHLSGLALCRGMGASRHTYAQACEVASVSGAAFAIHHSLFEQLGGFDEAFFLYVEDTDLSLRARLAGWSILYEPGAVVRHRYTLTFGPQKTYYQERNRYRMLLKVFHWRTLALLLPALLLSELVAWGFVLLHDRRHWRNKLQAWAWLWKNRRQLAGLRRRTQALRQVNDRSLLRLSATRLAYEQAGAAWAARGAHLVFDPLFRLARLLPLALGRC